MTMPTFTDGSLTRQGDLNLLSTGINNLSTYLMGGPAPRSTLPQVALRQTVAQNFPTSADTLVSFDTSDSNTDNMWVSSVKNQLTIQTAGTYVAGAQINVSTSTELYMDILLNGTNVFTNTVSGDVKEGAPSADGMTCRCLAFLPHLTVGSAIYVTLGHNAGSTLTAELGRFGPRVFAYRIGP